MTIRITEFVRGLAWHDIGKPFALATRRHAPLGYWLLQLSGATGEALVAWSHGDPNNRSLKQYLQTPGLGPTLPALLLLSNSLDRLAASVYSLQTRDLGEFTSWHSLQNPFTRLPQQIVAKAPPAITFKEIPAKWETLLWEEAVTALPREWRAVLTEPAKKQAEAQLQSGVTPLPAATDALTVLRQAMTRFPERTYPAVNDTSLEQHGRLAGILGFVVYRNLEQDAAGKATWLEGAITLEGDTLSKPEDPGKAVREHLAASLVRATFEGVRQSFESAARVDDLLGALKLAERLRQHFKAALAEQLQAPDLSEFLPVSEGEFELIYLLPGSESDPHRQVRQAYAAAIRSLAAEVVRERLRRDFPEAEAYRAALETQWLALPYGLRVLPVTPPVDNNLNRFAAEYGKRLLQAYVDSQSYAPVPEVIPDELPQAPLPVTETCDVCGTHPVWQPPAELDEAAQAEWLRKRNFAAHIFRGEREQICVSCAARRELAFGAVAKQLDATVHPMLEHEEQTGLWRAKQPDGGPALPPFLSAAVQLTASNELADAGACFVRYHRTASRVDTTRVDLFPAVSYAADATGNVVLLTLTPTAQLYATYPYQAALDTCAQYATDDNDAGLWQKTYADFIAAIGQNHEVDPTILRTVEPHLARVMERSAWIKRFYAQLAEQLLNAAPEGQRPLRVLPLEVGFPTLRLLLPADRLDDALHLLDQVVTETLFSATYAVDPAARQKQHEFLRLITPDLLHGAVILFKHKFPLYLALEAERALFRQLATSTTTWYGFRLAFSDLRGSLSEVGPLDATVTYGDLGEVLELVEHVDRPTLLQYAETRQYLSPELAQAQAVVRANHISRTQVSYVQRFEADPALFNAVYFITRAIRR